MKILIAGGGGFIGTHLTLNLLQDGHKIIILDNRKEGCPYPLLNKEIEYVNGSILNDNLVNSVADNSDYIINLASVVGVRNAMEEGIDTLRVCSQGTDNILKAALKFEKGVILASSSAVYGKTDKQPVNEKDDSLLGSSEISSWLYSIGKLTEENFAMAYYRETGVDVKVCRFFNVIGPYQSISYGMVVPTFISSAIHDLPLKIYGTGKQTRTFLYIDDAIQGIDLIMKKGKQGEIYNIGGVEEISINDLAVKIIKLTESKSHIEIIPYSEIYGKNFEETQRRKPDISKIMTLGYNPNYSLDDSLRKILDFYKKGVI
jgi:UDP-glucose 4-epimerase